MADALNKQRLIHQDKLVQYNAQRPWWVNQFTQAARILRSWPFVFLGVANLGEQSCESGFRQAQPNNCGTELAVAIPHTVLCSKPRESR